MSTLTANTETMTETAESLLWFLASRAARATGDDALADELLGRGEAILDRLEDML